MKLDTKETHKFLPSGIWEGFYCYNNSPTQHKMRITLLFSDNKVSGSGIDDVDTFKWKGKYNLIDFKIKLTKKYPTHIILYSGDIDKNGIWGIWEDGDDLSKLGLSEEIINSIKEKFKDEAMGGFHIWPKRKEKKSNKLKEEFIANKSSKLEEIFIEYFN
tara:strand:+ start:122 stop:601 length:480 start_codon:yes stop_codon:yes gene_type:complete